MVSLVDPKLPQARVEQKVIVIWGKRRDNKHVRDMWILDVASMTWKEVNLYSKIILTNLPIGYSVIVALTGLPIGYSVIVALTGLPIGYSVIVALIGLPIGYSVIVAPYNYLCEYVQLIVNTRARMFHMTSAYHRSHDYSTDVIIFGGNIQRKSKFDKHVVTETRVLKFGTY